MPLPSVTWYPRKKRSPRVWSMASSEYRPLASACQRWTCAPASGSHTAPRIASTRSERCSGVPFTTPGRSVPAVRSDRFRPSSTKNGPSSILGESAHASAGTAVSVAPAAPSAPRTARRLSACGVDRFILAAVRGADLVAHPFALVFLDQLDALDQRRGDGLQLRRILRRPQRRSIQRCRRPFDAECRVVLDQARLGDIGASADQEKPALNFVRGIF